MKENISQNLGILLSALENMYVNWRETEHDQTWQFAINEISHKEFDKMLGSVDQVLDIYEKDRKNLKLFNNI